MKNTDRLLAEKLLQISAIKLQPENPFVWASGWNSPIYNDNRRLLSYPDIRSMVTTELAHTILTDFEDVQAVAAVSTGAIAFGALAAEALGLPFVYVREKAKDHGLENRIEGNVRPRQRVAVVEDLVSTAGSAVSAIEALRQAGAEVAGMTALFSYEFPIAAKRLREADVTLVPLCTYSAMVDVAVEKDYVGPSDVETLREWRKDPANWMPAPKSF